jgi:hypothetical protein
VQHTVVGVDGATVPDATPPDGAQDPPVAVVVPVVITALSAMPEHAAGAGGGIMAPVQAGSPKVAIIAEHWMPVGGSHVQSLQARESTYEA